MTHAPQTAGSTYTYCYERGGGKGCPVDWFAEQVMSGRHQELANYAGVVGVDHYWTNQGVPCIDGKPHEFDNQRQLAATWKANFTGLRFLTYRILDAVPYDMVVQDQIEQHPEYFVRWMHEPGSAAPGNESVCYNYRDACFNSPTGINDPANNCSFQIRAAAYNWADPAVRAWYQANIIEPALEYADGMWLDGNGPDNGAYMCSGICCGFGADNSPHNQSEIDAYCAGEVEVATTAHEYMAAHGQYEVMSCSTYLRQNEMPVAGDAPAVCAAKMLKLAALGADHSKYNMVVAYGDRTAETGGAYGDETAAAAVASFMISRGEHWLMAIQPLAELNVSTARLLTLDYGAPLGNLTQVAANVFRREFANGTVQLDCNSFTGTFVPKHRLQQQHVEAAAAAAAGRGVEHSKEEVGEKEEQHHHDRQR